MLVTLDKGIVEIGYLNCSDKYHLLEYRNSLLDRNPNNFIIQNSNTTKELNFKEQYEERFYPKGENIVHEQLIREDGFTTPFETYNYLFKEEIIKCQNLYTIQILTRILKDWYKVQENKLIYPFVKYNIMKLIYTLPNSTLQVPDPCQSHKGMHKLLEKGREKDLESFQKSLSFLEHHIIKTLPLEEIATLNQETIDYYSLSTPLNEIMANSQILSKNIKVKKINH